MTRKKPFSFKSISSQLLTAFIFVVLPPALIISAESTWSSYQIGMHRTLDQLDTVVALKSAQITTWMNQLTVSLDTLMGERTVTGTVVPLLQGDLNPEDARQARERLLGSLSSKVEKTKIFTTACLFDAKGVEVVSTGPACEGMARNRPAFFEQALKNDFITPPFKDPSQAGRFALVIAHPILAPGGGAVGVLAAYGDMAVLESIMAASSVVGETDESYLVGADLSPVTHLKFRKNPPPAGVRSEGTISALENRTRGNGTYKDYNDILVLGSYAWLPELQVIMLVEQNKSEVFKSVASTLLVDLIVALMAVILAMFAASYIARSIAAPLKILSTAAAQISRGDLEQGVEVSRGDEIGVLAQAFNLMTSQLRTLIKELQTELARRKVEEETVRQLNATLEERVEERTIELVRANHIKDEFLAMISHELRTPLTSVLGFSETLLEGLRGPLNEKQEIAIKMIRSSGKHLLNIINDVLDISKIQSDNLSFSPQLFDVNEACKDSLIFVKQLAVQKSISVDYALLSMDRMLTADPQRLKQVLINLLNNAVKFTPRNGKVKLDVIPDRKARLMRFSVTDTGIGISAEDLAKLFKPFVQLDSKLSRQYEGTGLGLVLVKKMVEMQGGSVEVKSEPGVGSVFSFVLPWDPKEEPPLPVPAPKSETPKSDSPGRSRILIVDDDDVTVMLIKDYLEEFGYQVSVAENGRQCLPKVEEVSPDLILMDIQMPFANGLDLTRTLKADARYCAIPIIGLTAFAMQGDKESCLEAGMNAYLSKPVKLRDLKEMIGALVTQDISGEGI